jgi:hypothetical protein
MIAALIAAVLVALTMGGLYRNLRRSTTVVRRANAPEPGESSRSARAQASSYFWVRVRYKGAVVPLALTSSELTRSMTRGASNESDAAYVLPFDDAS